MTFQENCKYNQLIQKVEATTAQIVMMLRRIENKKEGMEEQDMLRLVEAFIVSRITYVASLTIFQVRERKKIHTIRKAYYQALAMPTSTLLVCWHLDCTTHWNN